MTPVMRYIIKNKIAYRRKHIHMMQITLHLIYILINATFSEEVFKTCVKNFELVGSQKMILITRY